MLCIQKKKKNFVCGYYKDGFEKNKIWRQRNNKKEFYSSKQAISLDSVDLDKIVVSNKFKINDTTYKNICGYLNNDTVQPLCLILPQIDEYIKHFDDGRKIMLIVTCHEEIYEKYYEIWKVIRNLLKIDFAIDPVHDYKYLTNKLKIYNIINTTAFNKTIFNNNNSIPIEKSHYIYIPAIDINSVLKIDEKVYPQIYLEQCKYKLKKRKIVNYIVDEIIDENSDSDIDDAIGSHLNFSVSDNYVKI